MQRIGRVVGALRFRRSVRAHDVFVVTYPKSGTTWIAFFLAHLVARRQEGHTPELDIATCRHWVPDVNPEYFGRRPIPEHPHLGSRRIFTVHAPYTSVLPQVVYGVRDPRAVMVSYFHYLRATKPGFSASLDEFVEANDVWPCDWGRHVVEWSERARAPRILLVRYEDLRTDPAAEFSKIARHCGFVLADAELETLCATASFENMARIERERHPSDHPFVRRGAVNGWLDELSTESIRCIEKRYGALLQRFGYEPAVLG